MGDVPIVVANDGDVTALAGYMSTGSGISSASPWAPPEAVGYVNADGNVLGWINELAFAPVDLAPTAMQDEWSTDYGVGCKYFSQDSVIKLAPAAGIELDPELSPAEKLKVVQGLANEGHEGALDIFRPSACTWRTRSCCTARSTRSRRSWCWAAWPPAWAATS